MEIQHFSHEHKLSFCELDDDDDQKPYLCSICGLPILSSPSYRCSNGCKFFLHKPCAQLPQQLDHPRHCPDIFVPHTLSLKAKPPPDDSDRHGKLCRIFTYSCSDCTFDLHPLRAVPVEIKSKHESHQSHPLAAICRETWSLCDACGEEQKGFFFSCQECDFWIHQDCTLLPSIVKHATHPDPFILTYSLSDIYQKLGKHCVICNRELLCDGLYFCGQCNFFAHLNCATSNMENLASGNYIELSKSVPFLSFHVLIRSYALDHVFDIYNICCYAETKQELIQLPDEGDTFPSLMIRTVLESKRIPEDSDDDDDDKLKVEKYHNHPLIVHDKDHFLTSNSGREACLVQELVCNACIQPISSPFYRCLQPDCHFLLHNFCANLPSSVEFRCPGINTQVSLCPDSSKHFFHSVFRCDFCNRPCNGFRYDWEILPFLVELECASAPNIIKHASHGQHVLFLTPLFKTMIPLSCCSDKSSSYLIYRCVSCDFMIHVGCALLPKWARHKFDKHPLQLITHWNKQDCCFCEFCEEDINQEYWFYHCAECDQSFHVNCIPSVGYLSKVKFGGTLNISRHHDHPVTLTRMLMEGSQRCGRCKKIIKGFVDDMAFQCSKCYFWIHFSCARGWASDGKSRLFFWEAPSANVEGLIQHFSHEHRLTFCEDKKFEDDEDDQKPYFCSICRLPILSSPSYSCSNGCKFFLHKPCAELPQELNHPWHRPHPLFLIAKPPRDDSECQNCRKLCQNFTYSCSSCTFDLHPLCATPVEIKSKHESHQSHPLVAICRETLSLCDACGEEQKGFFFSCQECNFWIHQDCTLLPSIVKHVSHPHPFILTYALSELHQRASRCRICNRKLLGKGLYFCGRCIYVAHLKCATSNMENLTSESKRIPEDSNDGKKLTVEKYHNHSLIFHDKDHFQTSKHDGSSTSSTSSSSREACLVQELVCNACTQPISSPFYRCLQPDCHFLVHNFCANLPSSIDGGHLNIPLVLWPDSSKYFFYSVFPCYFCHRPSNGFGYFYDASLLGLVLADLECASAPNTIKHTSHQQHVLFLNYPFETIPFSCCPDKSLYLLIYRCVSCDFMIHLGCAFLPKRVRHKFDEHPLELITYSNKQDYCFCEFCEEDIDLQYWFYHCAKCDQSFHVNCIPPVGYLSKVKFGGTLKISCHPDHPVTFTRMLTVGSQRCGYCKEIIEGFVDQMAFHCPKCEFWIHFSCASDCDSNDKSE
ncbi:hypothetical protein Pfo_000871 [Paulownia fortunei]|nr:hypothetical protein Pfo_000871 [Paulownia fortunei]